MEVHFQYVFQYARKGNDLTNTDCVSSMQNHESNLMSEDIKEFKSV